jgi:hypothetical protein
VGEGELVGEQVLELDERVAVGVEWAVQLALLVDEVQREQDGLEVGVEEAAAAASVRNGVRVGVCVGVGGGWGDGPLQAQLGARRFDVVVEGWLGVGRWVGGLLDVQMVDCCERCVSDRDGACEYGLTVIGINVIWHVFFFY